jgi:hypothetical protein
MKQPPSHEAFRMMERDMYLEEWQVIESTFSTRKQMNLKTGEIRDQALVSGRWINC